MREYYINQDMIDSLRAAVKKYRTQKELAIKIGISQGLLSLYINIDLSKENKIITEETYDKIKLVIPDFPKPVSIISQPKTSIPEHGYVIDVLKEKYHMAMNSEEKKEIISRIAKSDLADSLKVKVINIINDL